MAMKVVSPRVWVGAVLIMAVLGGCSLNKLAVRLVAGALTGEGANAFTTDDDPQLVGDALPFALKLYESLLGMDPENTDLLLATGTAYTMYAYAFVQAPAELLPDEEFEAQIAEIARARKLFLRGRAYLFDALEIIYPGGFAGYLEALPGPGLDPLELLDFAKEEDIDLFYWTASAWFAAVSTSGFDMSLIVTMPKAVGMLRKVLEWDEGYGDGGAHDLMVNYYGAGLDADPEWKTRAREHFERAVQLSEGSKAGMYISYAMAVCVPEQDVEQFVSLLEQALAVDIEAHPEVRLENVIAQQKARWLLENLEDYFLLPEVTEG
jgi:predicted anti-sigma-YlaC factor YlaD